MHTYKNHRCSRTHGDLRSFARCAVQAEWVSGSGRFAVIAWCAPITVSLYDTEQEALAGSYDLDRRGCGGRCRGRHQIFKLDPA